MYEALARNYDDEQKDRIYLFGFSRGAFAVRVLAGLLYRCGLPPKDADLDKCFAEAYKIYKPHLKKPRRIAKFKAKFKTREVDIHFLGIWDTVKAYGGIWPKSLPHLRHNPIVKTVRHALALHEHRSWFLPTSWGGIDLDDANFHSIEPDDRYKDQDVKEVWFRGCHSDVGGGDEEADTAKIPLKWMLKEATLLELNKYGEEVLAASDPSGLPAIHESLRCGWVIAEYIPRWELDNSRRPPRRLLKFGRTGERCVEKFRRKGTILIHPSVQDSFVLRTKYPDAE
jgi:uncharacterized protein (DUF2235 family)